MSYKVCTNCCDFAILSCMHVICWISHNLFVSSFGFQCSISGKGYNKPYWVIVRNQSDNKIKDTTYSGGKHAVTGATISGDEVRGDLEDLAGGSPGSIYENLYSYNSGSMSAAKTKIDEYYT